MIAPPESALGGAATGILMALGSIGIGLLVCLIIEIFWGDE